MRESFKGQRPRIRPQSRDGVGPKKNGRDYPNLNPLTHHSEKTQEGYLTFGLPYDITLYKSSHQYYLKFILH